ncbi:hypothetical protein FRC06_001729 [Ceratobasidium sp. 370]|nr:hypothetical protein FRC06_001729 [Ceratobasidium sp. 370]
MSAPRSPALSLSTEPSIYSPQPVYHPNIRSPSLRSQTLDDHGSPGKSLSLEPPTLTRGSSTTTSSASTRPPVTPFDDIPHGSGLDRSNTVARYYSAESSYGRHFIPNKDGSIASRPTVQTEPTESGTTTQVETPTKRYDVPLGQRIIATRSGTLPVVAPRMQRQHSAKELIDQCEQRDSSARTSTSFRHPQPGSADSSIARRNAQLPPIPLSGGTAVNPPRVPPSHCVPDGPSYFSSFAQSRGKLRNSFTNLVQLLGEKARARDKEKSNLGAPPVTKRNSISPSGSRTFGALPKGFKLKLGKRTSFGGGTSPFESPGKLEVREGVVGPDVNELLETEAILQIPNPRLSQLSSSKFQISLLDMYDVRSVEAKDLPPRFVVPPARFRFDAEELEDEELYVFEVESYGGGVQRFATGSLRRRKEWVSALMDAMTKGDKSKEMQDVEVHSPVAHPLPTLSHKSSSVRGIPPGSSLAPSLGGTPPLEARKSPTPAGLTPGLLLEDTTSSTVSILANPWDPLLDSTAPIPGTIRLTTFNSKSTTASPAPTRITPPPIEFRRTSTPASLRSVRTMSASPSISWLDEQSLVRNRLAVLERQASPSPSRSTLGRGVRSGSVGPIHWEALAEVRGGRSGSGSGSNSRVDSQLDSGLSMRATVSGLGEHRPVSVLSGRASERAKSPVETSNSSFRPRWPFPTPADEKVGNTASLVSRLTSRVQDAPPATPDLPRVHILGNIPPKDTRVGPVPNPVETCASPSFGLVSDRIASLTAALRESDVAHSTKASGLGQLIAGAQDQILQAVDESARVSSRSHAATIGHLERLQGVVQSLVPKVPDVEAQLSKRAEILAIKEVLERVDKGVAGQAVVVEKLDGLKEAMDGLVGKLGDKSAHEDVLAKLETLGNHGSGGLDPALVEELAQQLKAHISTLEPPATGIDRSKLDTSEIVEKLDTIATALANIPRMDLSEIQAVLEDIRAQSQAQGNPATPNPGAAPVDMSDVLMKLDGVSAMCQSFVEARVDKAEGEQDTEGLKQEANEKLTQLLAALREDAEHRAARAEQASELVRYSNELNAWLEKFVMNASTQMDSVGAGLGALRRDLGLVPPIAAEDQAVTGPGGALGQIHAALEEQAKAVGQVTATLNSLVTSINEDQAQNAEARQQLATEAVLKMIELQRQEQEQLLHKLATDLSSDIRGERLRFVEAMSHATSMNIQVHVEEFKKQLTREALALTDEVTRLRDERKTIQHQIAQLFLIKSEHEMEIGASPAPPVPGVNTRPGAKIIGAGPYFGQSPDSEDKHLPLLHQHPRLISSMLSTRFHDDVNIGGRGFPAKTPGRAGANLRKENPGGRGGAQTTQTGKGQERTSKNVPDTPGYDGLGQFEHQRLFKGGKVDAQQTQSIGRAFALLDKTNKTPHPKSRKAVSIMTPVAGSAQKPAAKPLFAPAQPQATNDAPQNTARRPSAGRLSIRAPSSVIREFKTPDARGRRAHWDIGDVDPDPDMDNNVEASNSIRLEGAGVEEEDELEYMPPTAIIPEYQPMFDMPDMHAFGQAVRSLTYSHWPKDEVDVLSTIRDDEVVDSCINDPAFHDLSSLDPPEDNPFPPRKSPAPTLRPLDTGGRSTNVVSGKGPKSAPYTRPASVAAVRAVSSSGTIRPTARPVSVISNRSVSAANTRPPSTVPPKLSRNAPAETTKQLLRRPGTAPGIRPREDTARVVGKVMVPKNGQAKSAQRQSLETHVVEALAVGRVALDDEFILDL